MESGPVRNMQITLSNKSEKLCISLTFIIIIYGVIRFKDSLDDVVLHKHQM